MRAARLLQMLLLLQNRGRQTSTQLAEELEVSTRTILRDVDAMTEAGLPIIVHQGNQGGIELGFEYRTRLTGLDADEAAAFAVMLDQRPAALAALGMSEAGARAAAKLREAFPDRTRAIMAATSAAYPMAPSDGDPDPRLPALANAILLRQIVRLQARSPAPLIVHPTRLGFDGTDWFLDCQQAGQTVPRIDWGDMNISSKRF
ncbi:MAG: HTH domain-containing protein [Pseudomonadota bacterium]